MADYDLGRYKYRTIYLKRVEENDFLDFNPAETFLEIGLKGTKQDGLVQKRMN